MKSKTIISASGIIIVCCFISNLAYGQFWLNLGSTAGKSYNEPDNSSGLNIESIGIGQFALSPIPYPLSSIHVNTNLFAFPLSYNAGEVFRTDCPTDISEYWRMFRGSTDATIEYGVIYTLSNADDYTGTTTGEGHHFYVQSSYRDADGLAGDLRFNSGGPNPRMRILGFNGYVGIGDYTLFRPQNLLHLHDNLNETGSTYAQWTNPTTNVTATDGLLIGNTTETAEIIQQEFAPLHFFTASYPRLQIFDGTGSNFDGNVGIGDFTTFFPTNLEHLHIPDDAGGNTASVYEQFTNGASISGPQSNLDGFRVGLTHVNPPSMWVPNASENADLILRTYPGQIRFYTDINNTSGPTLATEDFASPADRMRIDREQRTVAGYGDFFLTRVAIT